MMINPQSETVPQLSRVIAIIVWGIASTCVGAVGVSFTPLGDLPGGEFYSIPLDISADGKVVVGVSKGSNSNSFGEGFRWTAGAGMVGLGGVHGPPFHSQAHGVSADGTIVVGIDRSIDAIRWENSSPVSLFEDHPTILNSLALDVSDNGEVVVGQYTTGAPHRAYRWTRATGVMDVITLPGPFGSSIAYATSSDGTVVVGDLGQDDAFRWTADEGTSVLGDLPGGSYLSNAHDVSADGHVIVGRAEGALGTEAFRWTAAGGMVGLGDFPTGGRSLSLALGVSANGAVIVGSGHTASGNVAFVWDAVNGMRKLEELLVGSGIDVTGWRLQQATAVSDDGRIIVGVGTNPFGQTEGWLADISGIAIPEPHAYALVFCWIAAFTAYSGRTVRTDFSRTASHRAP